MRLSTFSLAASFLAAGLLSTAAFAGNTSPSSKITQTKHNFANAGLSGNIGNGQICAPCHSPHNEKGVGNKGPLWNHALSANTNADGTGTYTFAAYDRYYNNMNGGVGQTETVTLDANSMLCMGCHDGTQAAGNYGGNTGAVATMSGDVLTNANLKDANGKAIVNDMQGNHPMGSMAVYSTDGVTSPVYMNDLSLWDAGLTATTSGTTTTYTRNASDPHGMTLMPIPGIGWTVGCTTCHDPHGASTGTGTSATLNAYMLRVSNVGPAKPKGQNVTVDGSALCLTCHNK